jgi:hypothetical protein
MQKSKQVVMGIVCDDDIVIRFERTAYGQGPYDKAAVLAGVLPRLQELGVVFEGIYTILVGVNLHEGPDFPVGFTWRRYESGQKAIGFVFVDGQSAYPRKFALRPPAGIDVEELGCLLLDRPKSFGPKLIPVPTAANAQAVVPTVGAAGNVALAKVIAKLREYEGRLVLLRGRCDLLRQEITQLEAEVAQQPTLELLVAARLKELGL